MLETKAVNTKHGKRTFSYTGHKLWSAHSLDTREENNIENFKQKFKTLLFEYFFVNAITIKDVTIFNKLNNINAIE